MAIHFCWCVARAFQQAGCFSGTCMVVGHGNYRREKQHRLYAGRELPFDQSPAGHCVDCIRSGYWHFDLAGWLLDVISTAQG